MPRKTITDQNIISNSEQGFEDVFGKFIADGTQSEANIASQYPFNPERWRLYSGTAEESNRIFLIYNDDARYDHQRFNSQGEWDVHSLKPGSGETLILETPEVFRYVVGFESYITQAISVNQELNEGDYIRIGPLSDTDGYGIEFNGSLGPNRCKFFIRRNGTEIAQKEVSIKSLTEGFTRFGIRFAWYNIARAAMSQDYSQAGQQIKDSQESISTDGGRGPRQGNLPVRFEVHADSGTSGLVFRAGSCAWQTFGQIQPRIRPKFAHINTSIGTTATWVPFAAIRKRPDLALVNTKIQNVSLGSYSASGQLGILAIAVSPEKTDASNFVTPLSHSRSNSSIEHTTNITTFPDSDGNVVSSAPDPGGFQVGYSRSYDAGFFQPRVRGEQGKDVKRDINKADYVVLLANAANTGTLNLDYLTLQDW